MGSGNETKAERSNIARNIQHRGKLKNSSYRGEIYVNRTNTVQGKQGITSYAVNLCVCRLSTSRPELCKFRLSD